MALFFFAIKTCSVMKERAVFVGRVYDDDLMHWM